MHSTTSGHDDGNSRRRRTATSNGAATTGTAVPAALPTVLIAVLLLAVVLAVLVPSVAVAEERGAPTDEHGAAGDDHPPVMLSGVAGADRVMDDLADLVPALQDARSTPFQPDATSVSLSSATLRGQQYHDPCGDSTVGDLARLTALDDVRSVAWLWETCPDAPFAGTDDELVLFLIDATPSFPSATADLVLAQFMDGYVVLFDTLGSDDADDWRVLSEASGEVQAAPGGGVAAGSFVLDAAGVDFPLEYRFEVGSIIGDDIADALPKPGHPAPTFPTACTVQFEGQTQVLVAPSALAGVRAELESEGMTVTTTSAELGLLVTQHDTGDDGAEQAARSALAALEEDPRVRAVEPVVDRSRPEPPSSAPVIADTSGPTASGTEQARAGARAGDGEVVLADSLDPDWAVEQLRLPAAWQRVPAFSTEVAVIDSGIDPTRAGFGGRVGAGYDAVAGRTVPAGRDFSMGDHGTGVSAMIGAAQDGPVRGANTGATLRPVLLSSHDGCVASDRIAAAIEATLDMPDARIVNLSFGGPGLTVAEAAAIERAAAAGKVLVAATGNDGDLFPNMANYPAAHPDVIGVGASTADRLVAPFSQQGAVDVLAPGAEVVTYGGYGSLIVADGTSYSAPYISGALSLWLAANPVASTASARAALVAAADPVPVSIGGGAGIVDVDRLLADAGLPVAGAGLVFDDVASDSTHGAAIAALAAAGVTSGYPDGTFRPGEHVRRGQMATFLSGAFDLDVDAAPDPELSDVSLDSTHGPGVAAVVEAGFAGGFGDGTFRPGRDVTRGQMAAFLAAAMGLLPDLDDANGADDADHSGEPRFQDAAGTTHAAAIEAIAAAGVTSGFSDGTFRPNDPVTRAQMATFLVAATDLD